MQSKAAEVLGRKNQFLTDYRKDRDDYAEFAAYILSLIKQTLKNRSIQIAYSSARAKTCESLEKKCQKEKYDDPRNQIMDLAGVRLVTYLLQDVPPVRKIVEELFEVSEEDSGDKLELLGANKIGYLSVHYIVRLKSSMINPSNSKFQNWKCEIQIRTVLEDAWAQIFHDRQYKSALSITQLPELERRTNLISGSLELLDHNISELVTEYDSRQQAHMPTLDAILNQSITSDHLISYLDTKLGRKARFYDYNWIENLFEQYSIQTIRDFDDIVESTHEAERLRVYSETLTADQLIICILIVFDIEQFFKKAGRKFQLSASIAQFLSGKIEIERTCEKYGISINKQ